jgi:hypothetical protein
MRHLLSVLILSLGAAPSCKNNPSENGPVGVPVNASVETEPAASAEKRPRAIELLPLAEGNTWTYRVTGQSDTCMPGEHTRTVTRQAPIAGRSVLSASGYCGRDAATAFATEGNQILEQTGGAWRTYLADPLEEGHTWQFDDERSYHWHEIGWVQVPAGLFSGCWELLPADNYSSETYCKGVGMVAMSGSDLVVELMSFTLSQPAATALEKP